MSCSFMPYDVIDSFDGGKEAVAEKNDYDFVGKVVGYEDLIISGQQQETIKSVMILVVESINNRVDSGEILKFYTKKLQSADCGSDNISINVEAFKVDDFVRVVSSGNAIFTHDMEYRFRVLNFGDKKINQ